MDRASCGGWRLVRIRAPGEQQRNKLGGRRYGLRFLANLSCLLAVAGVVSTFYIGAPVIFLDPCG
jgi:hypothetical protein